MFDRWELVEADLQDCGVDVEAVRYSRSWRWLRVRILGLLSKPPVIVYGPGGQPVRIPQTRLGLALDPPTIYAASTVEPGSEDADL